MSLMKQAKRSTRLNSTDLTLPKTNAMATDASAGNNDTVAPAWASELRSGLKSDIMSEFKSYLDGKLDSLETKFEERFAAHVDRAIEPVTDRQDELSKRFGEQIKESDFLKKQIKSVQNELSNMRKHSMRNNIIFSGIPEDGQENNTKLRSKVCDLLKEIGFENPDGVIMTGCYRLRKSPDSLATRDVLVQFLMDSDRNRALYSARRLKGHTPRIFINQQLPRELEYERNLMKRVAVAARKKEIKAIQRDEGIILNGMYFNMETLISTYSVDFSEVCTEWSDDWVGFYGALSPLSNFHPSTFTIQGITYSSAEQYLQRSKAVLFNEFDVAREIMSLDRPLKMKALGDSLKIDKELWELQAPDLVREGLHEKFAQNPCLRAFLVKTEQRKIVECNSRDKYWGAGITTREAASADLNNLPGKNVLGNLLTEIRGSLADADGVAGAWNG